MPRPAPLPDTPAPPDEEDDLAGMPPAGAAAVAPLLVVPGAAHGLRLDRFLADQLPGFSRSRLQQWIVQGAVLLNGGVPQPRTAVSEGDRIALTPPAAPQDSLLAAEAMALDVVHADDDIFVLDKPPGLVVHPAPGHWTGTLANGLLHLDPALAGVPRAGIVHRLDADTSGLMVVARTLHAQTQLVRQLQAREVLREYWAIVHGHAQASVTVDAPLARDPRNPLRFAVRRSPTAREARTHVRLVEQARHEPPPLSWVACRLETGRTHQIRVHLESIGHPLVGDPVYRRGRPALAADLPAARFARQALHAVRLQLVHPRSGETLSWFRAPPADMRTLMKACGFGRSDRPREVFA
jgi:23S rRNA pseudouridine1911/1915/1917 synthase